MARSASLFGLLGLVFLSFGFVAAAITNPGDPIALVNLVLGIGGIVAYLAFGFDNFRSMLGQRSTRYGAGAALYSVLFIALVAGGNYIGNRRHHRWDVTERGMYTLSDQSKKVVDSLTQTLQMTAFVEGGVNQPLQSIFDSYKYVSDKVESKMVDPDKVPEMVDQMKITAVPSVHLRYGNENFIVAQPSEETITNGIIRVTRSTKKVVYFTEGFGEASTQGEQDPKGYSQAKLALEQENYEVKPLLLPSAASVPDDASVVIMAGPTRPLTDTAIAALDAYLKRAGHLLALVPARTNDEKFSAYLASWGVELGNDIVIDKEVRMFEGPRLGVQPLCRTYGTHPITAGFTDYTVYPQTRSATAITGKAGIVGVDLVKTSASSWAETTVDDVFTKGTASPDEGDKKGPVSIAVAITATLKDLGVPGATGAARLVVFGTQIFADNQQLLQSRLNADLFLNSVGWLVGQEELVSIRSRTVRASRAELTQDQAIRVFYLSVLIIPELLIAFGIAVWWRRRAA